MTEWNFIIITNMATKQLINGIIEKGNY